MKGHVRERSPGRWAIVIDLRDPVTGSRKRKWHSFAGTKRAAQVEAARLVHELKSGSYVKPAKETLTAFLDRWLLDIKARVSPGHTSGMRRSRARTSCRCSGPFSSRNSSQRIFPRLMPAHLKPAAARMAQDYPRAPFCTF